MDTTSPIMSGPTPTEVPRAAQRRSKADRFDIARAWSASGLNAEDFALQNGVTVSSLTRWRRELVRASRDGEDGSFIELTVTSGAPASSAIEIVVAGRHHIRVARGFDEVTLARVVRTLQDIAT